MSIGTPGMLMSLVILVDQANKTMKCHYPLASYASAVQMPVLEAAHEAVSNGLRILDRRNGGVQVTLEELAERLKTEKPVVFGVEGDDPNVILMLRENWKME